MAGAIDIATLADGVSKGYQAAQAGDVQAGLDIERDALNAMLTLPPGLKELGGIFFNEQQKQINAQRSSAEKITTQVENMKGGMVQATQRAADRSTAAAERTRGAIWAAARANRPIVTVINRVSVSATNYVTASHITRLTRAGIC